MAESGNEIKRENSVDRAFGGLISADDGNGDTSVHHSAVRCDGFRNLNQGEAVDNSSAKAENVTGSDDDGSIVVSSEGFESTTEGENEVKRGTVNWYSVERGFGFITADDGSGNIFVHHSAIRCNGFRALCQGESVEFHLVYRDDGRASAANVTGPDGAPVRCGRDRSEQMLLRFKRLKIDNAFILFLLVSHIFEKAITEPTSCEMYANVCFHLAADLPEFESDNRRITFKRLILNKCQEEFERIERTEDANNADEVEVNQTEEQRIEARRRMLGNIRFLGELYKVKMLTERIMHGCINKLLGSYTNPDEENIEALCVLMNTIGEMIDHPKAKDHLDAYFDIMRQLSGNMNLCSRVRLMLVDTISLRKFGWNHRRQVGDAIGLPKMRRPEVLWYKSMAAIKKFYSTRDEKDVALRIKDLNAASFYPSMISLWILDSFERNDGDRDLLIKCLIYLSEPKEDGIISRDNLIEGIESVIVVLEDAVNDAPKAAEYLGRTLAKLILAHSISLSEIGSLILEGGDERGRLVEIGLGAEVMGAVLDTITSEKDDSVLNEMLAESNLELGKFMPYRSCRLDKYI